MDNYDRLAVLLMLTVILIVGIIGLIILHRQEDWECNTLDRKLDYEWSDWEWDKCYDNLFEIQRYESKKD